MWVSKDFRLDDGLNKSMASYDKVTPKAHVLLVDHDSDCLITTKMLEFFFYKVTYVELASTALSLLLCGDSQFDIILANRNSPDFHGYKLLNQAVKMEIPVILMTNEDNEFLAMGALEQGAFLYVKKPVTMEVLKLLWQHVLREKFRKNKQERVIGISSATNGHKGNNFAEGGKGKNKVFEREDMIGVDKECELEHQQGNNKVERKECIEWTEDLHEKFMDALSQLGEGRCFPKDILEVMNVAGLTRIQVSSHLQKLRNGRRRANEVEKLSDAHESSKPKPRRYGTMPRLDEDGLPVDEPNKGNEAPKNIIENEINGYGENADENVTLEQCGKGNGDEILKENEMQINSQHGFGDTTGGQNSRFSCDDDLIYFPDVDCLWSNFYGMQQGFDMEMNQVVSQEEFHADRVHP